MFDIAHQKQVNAMRNEAATTLLNLHRESGRNGCLDAIIDTTTWGFSSTQEEEERKEERPENLEQGMQILYNK